MQRGNKGDSGGRLRTGDTQIDRLFRGPFTDRAGKTFNYVEFAKSLSVNADGEMKEDALRA